MSGSSLGVNVRGGSRLGSRSGSRTEEGSCSGEGQDQGVKGGGHGRRSRGWSQGEQAGLVGDV